MTAGAISVPTIIPLRAPVVGQPKTAVDSNTKIEIKSETSGVTVYYTLNGSKPDPFQTIGPAAKATFTYHEPITLPSGKRTVKAVAVSRDGRESFVVTKVFDVEHIPSSTLTQGTDGLGFINDIPANEEAKREVRKFAGKMMTGKEAWAEIQKMKEAEEALGGGYGGIFSSKRKPPTGPRFLNNRFGNVSDRTINGNDDHLDSARTDAELFSHRWKAPPNDATQALRLQRETDFMKCIHCFAQRPSDPFARFCNECGNTIAPLPQTRLPPPEPGQMGTCVSCKALVPLNTSNCLVCEAPLGPQNVPQATIKLADRLLCIVCGTTNSPHLKMCVTCGSSLPDSKLIQHQMTSHSIQSSRSEFNRTTMMTCSKCGRVNSSEARFCDWCGTKPSIVTSTVPLICTKCHGTNSPYAQFCGMCGGVLAAPLRPELRNSGIYNGSSSMPQVNGKADSQWLPVNVVVAPSRSDAVTQTVGLFFPSQQKLNLKNQEMEDKLIVEKEMRDRKPLLTAISPGRGYWRKQIEHICGHLKAHSSNDADFRALIGEPRMGKLLSATVHEDGFELSLTINFALRGTDGSFVGKPTGVTNDLLSSYTTGRRAESVMSYASQDSLDSIENNTARSRKGQNKSTKRNRKKIVKRDDENNISEEDKKLLKEVGKFGEGHTSEVQQLVEEGASPNCVNKDGVPVLHVAVINKHVDAIPVLVQEGADVNMKGPNKGNTALHEAITLGPSAIEVIDVLLGCGANTRKKNDKGETPYDLAIKAGYDSLAKKLATHIGQSTIDKLVKPKPSHDDL